MLSSFLPVFLLLPLICFLVVLIIKKKHGSEPGCDWTLWDITLFLKNLIIFRVTWGKHDCNAHPSVGAMPPTPELKAKLDKNQCNKFFTATQCVSQIPRGSTVLSCGFAGSEVCQIFYYAIKEKALADLKKRKEKRHDWNLTWVTVNAHGTRGKAPGSVDELGLVPGVVTKYIAGHLETARGMLKAGAKAQWNCTTCPWVFWPVWLRNKVGGFVWKMTKRTMPCLPFIVSQAALA